MNRKILISLGAVALFTVPAAASAQGWSQPGGFSRGDEPIAVPRTIKQGIDFVYVDPKLNTVAKRRQKPRNWLQRLFSAGSDAPQRGANPMFMELERGLHQYHAAWGRLPQTKVPAGAALKRGAKGARVNALRSRLGLPPGTYDEMLFQRVSTYQQVHGLGKPDGIAGRATIASLNRGANHYAKRIAINMERAYRLPPTGTFDRYILVDSGAAQVSLFDRDRRVDSMKAIVGSAETKTPIMAVILRNAKANPYWNVPPELVQSMTAKRVREQGVSYLKNFHYEVLEDWSPNAQRVDPKTINWRQVAAGNKDIRVRQLPGPWNSMGEMKFETPNDYGIYLHDTPVKENFAKEDRWISNGCVRLEDYRRFASWAFGGVPQASSGVEQTFEVPRPLPVYMTYLTVAANPQGGIMFRPDPYGFDALAMPQMFG